MLHRTQLLRTTMKRQALTQTVSIVANYLRQEYKHFSKPIAGPPARGRINPLLQRSNVSSDSETGQNAVFKKRNVSGQHQKRATSPLPDNLPKGPKSMASW